MNLVSENVVITARNLNPSVVTERWLLETGIAGKEEFSGGLYTPMFVHVKATAFELLVTPDRAQFIPAGADDAKAETVSERLGKFVNLLPHTPYSAVGINFVWHLDVKGTLGETTRRLFLNPTSPVADAFSSADAAFGAYYSKQFEEFRLKLTVLPILTDGQDTIQLSFNYHKEVGQNVELIQRCLGRWATAKREAHKLVSMFEAR